jgi:hypothetical protein
LNWLALGLPLAVAVLDQLENFLHLRLSATFARDMRLSGVSGLAALASGATLLKMIGFLICLGASLWVIGSSLWHDGTGTGPAGLLALVLGGFLGLSFLVKIASAIKEMIHPAKQRVRNLPRETADEMPSKNSKLA